jgi:hypothetical protein
MAFDPKKKKPGVGITIAVGGAGKDKPSAAPPAAPSPKPKPGMPDLPPFAQKKAPGASPAPVEESDPEPDPNDPNEAMEPGEGEMEGGSDMGGEKYSAERSGFRRASAGEVCGNCSNYDHANQSCSKVAEDQIDPNDTCGVFFSPVDGGEEDQPPMDDMGPMPGGGGGGGAFGQ